MSIKSIALTLTFLWDCVTALPAHSTPATQFWEKDTTDVSFVNGSVLHAAAYSLVDTYDASNWLSKFDVQAVSQKTFFMSDADIR